MEADPMPSRISAAASLTLLAAFSAKAGPEVSRAYAACAIAVSSSIQQNWLLPQRRDFWKGGSRPSSRRIEEGRFLARPAVVASQVGSPLQQAIAASAVRAAEKSQPFSIRPEFYEQCQMILAFHP
jgi:hypothetical protein